MALSLSRYVWPYGQSLAPLFKERSQKEREMSIAMTTMPGNLLSTEDVNCVSQAGELESLELLLDETPRVLSYDSLHMMPFHSPFLCGPCDGIFYIPQYDAYGFGLHPVTKDYEVVVLKDLWREKEEERGGTYPLRVFVYSSSTDSWRHWGDLSRYYNLQNNKCYICMDGVFFWLGSYEISGISPEVIISFDMATEICQEIQQPDYCRSNDSKSLATYHDSLALVVLQEMFLHMWTLNEGCWIKKVSIGPLPQISRPIGHWKSNKLILVSVSGELILCDPSTQEISDLEFIGCSQCVGVFDYKESLVLVNNGNGCAKHNQKADTESSL
ncbi:F-BOX PROTEIN INTERACTION DOMAIN PROTEIN [Salix koriyanagi]|uniref:F-BOX PROTEIN INTERACTION DOMAIN PROTEIN n=1 Tax=Salix koriyanagi TaxID=2511006 RepID=A0A9Q0VDA9_9ROSI|nr:F-BOX PROTEIN INTERACTION DOMAIN PROTEIN [Salix koriyanagi]